MIYKQSNWICSNGHEFIGTGRPVECPHCGSRIIRESGNQPSPGRLPVRGGSRPMSSPQYAPAQATLTSKAFKGWFSALYLIAVLLSLPGAVCLVWGRVEQNPGTIGVGFMFYAAAIVISIPWVILWFIALHRSWSAIQPLRGLDPNEALMPTPGKAVGFLFIPIFSIYWIFVAYVGLARRANRYAEYCGLGRVMSESIPVTICILGIVTAIAAGFEVIASIPGNPILGLALAFGVLLNVLTLAGQVLAFIFFLQSVNAANKLAVAEPL